MTYLIPVAVIILFLVLLFVREMLNERKRRRQFRQSLYDKFGQLPDKKITPEREQHIPGYYRRHSKTEQLDDITWNDLSMDDIFRRMNYTHSATGEEYLYYLLRTPVKDTEQLEHLEDVTGWLWDNPDARVDLQVNLSELGYTGKHSLYDYIENLDDLGKRGNLKHYLADALYIPFIILLPFQTALALFGISALGVYQIVTYFKDKGQMEPYIISFAYITRLIKGCEKIGKMQIPVCEKELNELRECVRSLKGIKSGSFWIFTASNSRTSGNPLEVIMDYLRMVFHVDLIIFNKMLRQLKAHVKDVDTLITNAGFLESAASICWLRASMKEGFCVPEFDTGNASLIDIKEGYHLLLEQPVKNSIHTSGGVLLTGSNASGKSTFLKMTAINAVLAQTVHTCAADAYRGSYYSIYSSMSLRDNIESGESYYIVEIKALKRILDAVKRGERVLCFVDEVLRGTNTVERIAASTEILKSLGAGETVCFAATHDIELTELLASDYDNYHFEEEIQKGDIFFPYRLKDGKATTRNAIRLLELMGYSDEITCKAMRRAQRFVDTGIWENEKSK